MTEVTVKPHIDGALLSIHGSEIPNFQYFSGYCDGLRFQTATRHYDRIFVLDKQSSWVVSEVVIDEYRPISKVTITYEY